MRLEDIILEIIINIHKINMIEEIHKITINKDILLVILMMRNKEKETINKAIIINIKVLMDTKSILLWEISKKDNNKDKETVGGVEMINGSIKCLGSSNHSSIIDTKNRWRPNSIEILEAVILLSNNNTLEDTCKKSFDNNSWEEPNKRYYSKNKGNNDKKEKKHRNNFKKIFKK